MTPKPTDWPTWPFTRLSEKEMADLLKRRQADKLANVGEALV
jgi:hypothetical protein